MQALDCPSYFLYGLAQYLAPVDKPVERKTTRSRGCLEGRLTKSVDTPEQLSSCVLLQSVRGANPLQVTLIRERRGGR